MVVIVGVSAAAAAAVVLLFCSFVEFKMSYYDEQDPFL